MSTNCSGVNSLRSHFPPNFHSNLHLDIFKPATYTSFAKPTKHRYHTAIFEPMSFQPCHILSDGHPDSPKSGRDEGFHQSSQTPSVQKILDRFAGPRTIHRSNFYQTQGPLGVIYPGYAFLNWLVRPSHSHGLLGPVGFGPAIDSFGYMSQAINASHSPSQGKW